MNRLACPLLGALLFFPLVAGSAAADDLIYGHPSGNPRGVTVAGTEPSPEGCLVQFARAGFSAGEQAGRAILLISFQSFHGQVELELLAEVGTADGGDFEPGTFLRDFPQGGNDTYVISRTIFDDGDGEGDETFLVSIVDGGGCSVVNNSTAVVTILDATLFASDFEFADLLDWNWGD